MGTLEMQNFIVVILTWMLDRLAHIDNRDMQKTVRSRALQYATD